MEAGRPRTLEVWRSTRREDGAVLISTGWPSLWRSQMKPPAYFIPGLREHGPVNDIVAGVPLAVLTHPEDPDQWAVFSRRLDDVTLTLVLDGTRLVDLETGTTWDPVRGIALAGPLKGEVLDLLPGFTSFRNDFFTFWPDGRLWEGA